VTKFRLADADNRNEWNEVVQGSNASEIYHLFEWSELLERTYGIRVFRLVAEVDGKISGILPFVQYSNPFFGRKLVSLPFADEGGVCTKSEDDSVAKGLVHEFMRLAKRLNVDFAEVRSLKQNEAPLIQEGFVEGFEAYSYLLNTSLPYDTISRNYGKKIRHNIKKMKAQGLEIIEAQSRSDVNIYYRIYLERMKDFGTPPAPLSFWKNMWDIFHPKGMMKLIFTFIDNRPAAGFVALLFKKKLYFALNVSLRRFWKYYGLNEMLFDWYIQYACKNGYDSVDFGRTRRGTGVQKFKEKGWGVERIPLCTYYYFLQGKARNPLETALDTDTNLYSKAWRTLVPTSLTPTLGYFVRKSIGDV
jgi:hypothetical protein